MNETELKNIIQKAHSGDALFNDPLLQEWLTNVKHKLFIEFQKSELKDDEARKDVWRKTQLLNSFLDEVSRTIKDGKNAKLKLMDRAKNHLRNVI